MKKYIFILLIIMSFANISPGQYELKGQIFTKAKSEKLPFASVKIKGTTIGTTTNEEGEFSFKNLQKGKVTLITSFIGMLEKQTEVILDKNTFVKIELNDDPSQLNEVVVTGNLKEMSKAESAIPIDIITPAFFAKNPTPNIFEALQSVNGVRPQVNCNVCNTGDIHINGLEGPYTMILIDGMPIVSSLGSVYGLFGIPNGLIERIEVVKGPASTLYGSEAVGGLINIITKVPLKSPKLSLETNSTSWGEWNSDLGLKYKLGKVNALLGVNYFNFGQIIDKNLDGFTDLSLQNRISVFNKFQGKTGSVAFRYFYENRWGGQTNWTPRFRGTDQVYGESIFTKRVEVIGAQNLSNALSINYSYNSHQQDSFYGNVPLIGTQHIGFLLTKYQKTIGNDDLLIGLPLKYNFYDDNTVATQSEKQNQPLKVWVPGIFAQHERKIGENFKTLEGVRLDYNQNHGLIFTPRLALKWNNKLNILRLNVGKGYRIVNVFAEEHAAMTGAREVEITENLKPEQSWNINLNFNKKILLNDGFFGLDASAFYTYFSNKIIPDYDTTYKIIYKNLEGFLISRGSNVNIDLNLKNGLKLMGGVTFLDVQKNENGVKTVPYFTEKFSANYTISYEIMKPKILIDYSANLVGPMRLPLLNEYDPRPGKSPWTNIQNLQLTRAFGEDFKIYGGVKNIFNFVPYRNLPFLISRANDPFDKKVIFNEYGEAERTAENPYGLTFDPTYVYTSLQSRRVFLGIKYNIQ
ncbi:TonB-dependent receptor [Lacihabitans soyangensis]|uniref:TonB-dependent receptor n=1 Tax=Lacihabitans soyangensis TaxID=869394 RepID=A0AAE3H8H5_9BACT|nr:TonB-dependent receptor plug domain-containing protein [Lacihabitans soyangensis]MCP9766126.1 TonB-dependent receptor [Lacihabitans soyangensis]